MATGLGRFPPIRGKLRETCPSVAGNSPRKTPSWNEPRPICLLLPSFLFKRKVQLSLSKECNQYLPTQPSNRKTAKFPAKVRPPIISADSYRRERTSNQVRAKGTIIKLNPVSLKPLDPLRHKLKTRPITLHATHPSGNNTTKKPDMGYHLKIKFPAGTPEPMGNQRRFAFRDSALGPKTGLSVGDFDFGINFLESTALQEKVNGNPGVLPAKVTYPGNTSSKGKPAGRHSAKPPGTEAFPV